MLATPARRTALAAVIAAALVAGATLAYFGRSGPPHPAAEARGPAERTFESNDPIERGCALSDEMLVRIWRGHHPVHSEDVTIVPQAPNYSGSFDVTSHSGPWDYLAQVPLVVYGPERIRARGIVERHASLIDVYPTIGALTGADLPERDGEVLDEALRRGVHGHPKAIVVVMWDGVGRNVLERHPESWPTLAMMERDGTSYRNASVGSSPSITPATHTTLGTGVYPNKHGITAIEWREEDIGRVRSPFARRDPRDLRMTTFGDEVQRAFDGTPKVGMIAGRNWHLGMLGHGTAIEGGSPMHLGLIGEGTLTGNRRFYETPGYLKDFPGLHEHADALDREDGVADGRWMGHEILAMHDNPAWVRYQHDAVMALLQREGYGLGDGPDVFVTNYKPSDIVGHQHNMDSEEMAVVLSEQDRVLGEMLDYLDDAVGDYVVIVTSDHGNTPPASRTGAWPLFQGRMRESVNAHFGLPEGETLFRATSAVGPFLRNAELDDFGVTAENIAEFLNVYTIRENWIEGEALPEGYEERGDENVLSAAFSKAQLPEVMRCRFGSATPPDDIEA